MTKLNPNQFQLFMTGQELQNKLTTSMDLDDDETMDDLWKRKTEESKKPEPETRKAWNRDQHGAGVYDSLKQHGYRGEPLGITYRDYGSPRTYTAVNDGHHRIAAAAALERETGRETFIPVEHIDNGLQFRMIHQHARLGIDGWQGLTPPK